MFKVNEEQGVCVKINDKVNGIVNVSLGLIYDVG